MYILITLDLEQLFFEFNKTEELKIMKLIVYTVLFEIFNYIIFFRYSRYL